MESRCGLLCSKCEYRKTGCKGCSEMDKPLWADSCPVKSCCEGKKFEHCGECENFACELLHGFSYDAEHGDNGLRIAQCRAWTEQKIKKQTN